MENKRPTLCALIALVAAIGTLAATTTASNQEIMGLIGPAGAEAKSPEIEQERRAPHRDIPGLPPFVESSFWATPTGRAVDNVLWLAGAGSLVLAWLNRNTWVIGPLQKIGKWTVDHLPGREFHRLTLLVLHVESLVSSTRDATHLALRDITVVARKQDLWEERMDMATFRTDHDGHCVYVNRRYLELTGTTYEDIIGNGWKNVICEKDHVAASEFLRRWEHCVKDEINFCGNICLMNMASRTRVHCRVDAYVVRDSLNNVVGWLGYVSPDDEEINSKRKGPLGPFEPF